MAGEKAKENMTLTSSCAGCAKSFSTELLHGVIVGVARNRRIVPVCETCLEKGWSAETPESSGEKDAEDGDRPENGEDSVEATTETLH